MGSPGVLGTKIINGGYRWWWDNMKPSLTVFANGSNVGVAASPSVPGTLPWSTIDGCVAWIKGNWGAYGGWGYGKDEVLLYLGTGYYNATLSFRKVS